MSQRGPRTSSDKFRLACARGRTSQVNKLLNLDSGLIRAATNHGYTGLHAASARGHLEIVDMLLDFAAQVNCATNVGMTPLMYASASGHTRVVEALLSRDASVGDAVPGVMRIRTADDLASGFGHSDINKVLARNRMLSMNKRDSKTEGSKRLSRNDSLASSANVYTEEPAGRRRSSSVVSALSTAAGVEEDGPAVSQQGRRRSKKSLSNVGSVVTTITEGSKRRSSTQSTTEADSTVNMSTVDSSQRRTSTRRPSVSFA